MASTWECKLPFFTTSWAQYIFENQTSFVLISGKSGLKSEFFGILTCFLSGNRTLSLCLCRSYAAHFNPLEKLDYFHLFYLLHYWGNKSFLQSPVRCCNISTKYITHVKMLNNSLFNPYFICLERGTQKMYLYTLVDAFQERSECNIKGFKMWGPQ